MTSILEKTPFFQTNYRSGRRSQPPTARSREIHFRKITRNRSRFQTQRCIDLSSAILLRTKTLVFVRSVGRANEREREDPKTLNLPAVRVSQAVDNCEQFRVPRSERGSWNHTLNEAIAL